MASKKTLEAALKITGELDASLRRAIQDTSERMDAISDAAATAEKTIGALDAAMSDQATTLSRLKTQYVALQLSGDGASQEAQALEQEIVQLSSALNANRAALAAAEAAADRLTTDYRTLDDAADRASAGLDDSASAASRAKEGFTVLKGALAIVAAEGFQRIVSGATDAVRSLVSLSDQTRELRADLATLDVAYTQAGFTADQARDTWKSLYQVIGEDDRAVETANNIARMAETQSDLNDWLTITTGAWAIYQDALPIENLAEAAGETAKTGTVTGGLADALNWSTEVAERFAEYMGTDVVSAEDAFNEALAACTTEQERQALINDVLLDVYSDAAGQYDELTGSLQDAYGATADLISAQADLGEIIEPITTAWDTMKAKLLQDLAPALETIVEKLEGIIDWLGDHPQVIAGAATVFGVLAGSLTAVATAAAAIGVAGAIASAGLTPILGAAAAVIGVLGLLTGAGVLLYMNWDTLKAKAQAVWDTITAAFTQVKDLILQDLQALMDGAAGIWQTILTSVQQVWTTIKAAFTAAKTAIIADAQQAWDTVLAIFTAAKGTIIAAAQAVVSGIVGAWQGFSSTVKAIWEAVRSAISSVWEHIKSDASRMASRVVDAISSKWNSLTSILRAPFESVSGLMDTISSKASSLVSGPSSVGSRISSSLGLGTFAEGGFTNGPSIAGEAGTEAVISFDPAYRADNLRYWAQAGRMLGADSVMPLSADSIDTGASSTVIESINFAPNITITGSADKQDIIAAIRDTYPEFVDLVNEVLSDREVGVYAI